jgi:hypothetical protein
MKQRKAVWLMALVLVLISATAVAVVPSGDVGGKVTAGDRFSARVAEILELDQPVVAGALRQAKEELRANKVATIEANLGGRVVSGEMTQKEADAKLQWFLDRGKKTGSRTKAGWGKNR